MQLELDQIIKQIKSERYYDKNRSYNWFRSKIVQLLSSAPINTANEVRQATFYNLVPGNFYLFQYDPKYKDTMPYYDMFPLVCPINMDKNSMLGLNFHYIHPRLRLMLLARLMKYAVSTGDNRKRLMLQWATINDFSKFPGVQHCIKRYLFDHAKSRYLKVPTEDWVIMSQLPTEKFVGKASSGVWRENKSSSMVWRNKR